MTRLFHRFWALLLVVGMLSSAQGAEFRLVNGDILRGELASATPEGIIVRLETGGFSQRADYARLTDETLADLYKNPKASKFVEPFLAPPAEEIARMEAKQITVKPPPRVVNPEVKTGLGSAFKSTNGALLLLVLFGANLFFAYTVARFRWRPTALVCGLAVVLPVVGPLIFLALPKPEAHDDSADQTEAEPTAVPMAASTAENRVSSLGVVKNDKGGGNAQGLPKVFPRGEFTLNRRFFETQFPSFFRVVATEADKDLVLDVSAGKKSVSATRISRISATEIHFKTTSGAELGVPFADITQVTLRHKDAKS